MASKKRFAIIVAGGTGTRMNSEIPKQFLLLANKPVLMHSIEKFHQCHAKIVVVLHRNLFSEWKNLCTKFHFKIEHDIAEGGETRSESVLSGLKEISEEEGLVAIHDAARPLISTELINILFDEAVKHDNAVPAITVFESLRHLTGSKNAAVNRHEFVTIQTPQCFHLEKIKDAYSKCTNPDFTDDATLYESFGNRINLVGGEKNNFKITLAEDLKVAEALLTNYKL